MALTKFQKEKTPLQAIKRRSSKSRKIDILTNVFYDILERKNAFLGYKKKKLKKFKNWDLSERVLGFIRHGFGQKFLIFPCFDFRQNTRGKCVLVYSRKKKGFLDYKNNKLKKSKNRDFSKGVSLWFWSKVGHFSIFLFQAKYARKMSFKVLQKEKKCLFRV